MKKKQFFFTLALICIVVLILFGISFYIYKNTAADSKINLSDSYKNWFVYENTFCHYSLKYPYTWDIDLSRAYNQQNNTCDKGSDIVLSREGYQFEFKYLSNVPVEKVRHFDSFTTHQINGESFTKAYINSCTISTTANEDCQTFDKKHISSISYDNAADLNNNFASTSFYLKSGKIASLVLSIPNNSVLLKDTAFMSIDKDINKIADSIQFPK